MKSAAILILTAALTGCVSLTPAEQCVGFTDPQLHQLCLDVKQAKRRAAYDRMMDRTSRCAHEGICY